MTGRGLVAPPTPPSSLSSFKSASKLHSLSLLCQNQRGTNKTDPGSSPQAIAALHAHPSRNWAEKINLACHGLISVPDTLNFAANLLSLLPDVVSCRQMLIILNSYRRLTDYFSSLMRPRKRFGGVRRLTLTAAERLLSTSCLSSAINRCKKWEEQSALSHFLSGSLLRHTQRDASSVYLDILFSLLSPPRRQDFLSLVRGLLQCWPAHSLIYHAHPLHQL